MRPHRERECRPGGQRPTTSRRAHITKASVRPESSSHDRATRPGRESECRPEGNGARPRDAPTSRKRVCGRSPQPSAQKATNANPVGVWIGVRVSAHGRAPSLMARMNVRGVVQRKQVVGIKKSAPVMRRASRRDSAHFARRRRARSSQPLHAIHPAPVREHGATSRARRRHGARVRSKRGLRAPPPVLSAKAESRSHGEQRELPESRREMDRIARRGHEAMVSGATARSPARQPVAISPTARTKLSTSSSLVATPTLMRTVPCGNVPTHRCAPGAQCSPGRTATS